MSVKENLKLIQNKISEAEYKAGRSAGSVKLMAVSKFHTIEEIQQAIDAGQTLFGENRVQEAEQKFTELYKTNKNIHLHMIGQLQTNKVKTAVQIAECIESVDRLDLIKEIEKQCAKINKTIDILFEIHTGEESKAGFETEEELLEVLDLCEKGTFPHVNPCGFMTMAPFTEDVSLVKKSFTTLKDLSGRMQQKYPMFKFEELSMGMSGDFELAIAEGSTCVRVGTAIFGERDYSK